MHPILKAWRRVLPLAVLFYIGMDANMARTASSAPAVTIASVTCPENATPCDLTIAKTKATSYSKITLVSVDGTAKAGVDFVGFNKTITLGNTTTRYVLPITILNNSTFQGPRSFTVKVTAVRFAQAPAPPAVTIADDETAPLPPTPPPATWATCAQEGQTCTISGTAQARYGGDNGFGGQSWAYKTIIGSTVCDAVSFNAAPSSFVRHCETTGTIVAPAPAPVPEPTPPPTPVPAPTPPPAGACPNGIPRLLNGDCPPGNGISMMQCPNKVYVLLDQLCPPLPPVGQWVAAPIQSGGWVQVVKGQPGWPSYGYYGKRAVARAGRRRKRLVRRSRRVGFYGWNDGEYAGRARQHHYAGALRPSAIAGRQGRCALCLLLRLSGQYRGRRACGSGRQWRSSDASSCSGSAGSAPDRRYRR
jgi:hypothetical protein